MSNIIKRILTILFIVAVLGYVIFSHMTGKSDTDYFLVATAMLSFFLIGMIRGLIQDLNNK